MAEAEGIAMEEFRVLVKRAGLNPTNEELESLKPMYDYYVEQKVVLDELDLGAEDLATIFSPNWEPQW